MKRHHGFTLIEMMVTLAILAIALTLAVPSFTSMLERQRLNGAAERIYTDMQLARSEAVKLNQKISLSFTTDGATKWCYAMSDNAGGCNCNTKDSCQITINGVATSTRVVSSSDFDDVSLTTSFTSNLASFTNPRGNSNGGTVTLKLDANRSAQVTVDKLGTPRMTTDLY